MKKMLLTILCILMLTGVSFSAVQIQLRRDTAANWTSANPTLASGEIGIETDTTKTKVGDGTTAWTSLAYQSPFVVSGTNIYNTNTGNVGIGTTAPTQKLDVNGNIKASNIGTISSLNTGTLTNAKFCTYATGGTIACNSDGGGGATATRGTFTNASLSAGVLTITHNLGLSAPYSVIVVIFNNSGVQIIPDSITGATNSVAIDLTSYGTLVGTYGYAYIAG